MHLDMNVDLCLVCGDRASGRHYGAISCEGCKGFFKRSIRKQLGYQCRGTMDCEVTKHHRNRCQYCRLQKCLNCGMRSDSVQHERKPIVDKKEQQPTGNPLGSLDSMFVFPMGFNLSDFKNSNSFSGASTRNGDGGSGSLANCNNNNNGSSNFSSAAAQQLRDDDSSTDNKSSSTNLFQTLSNFTPPNPDLIQANLEKMMIADALEVIVNLPTELNADNELDDSENNGDASKGDSDTDMNGGGEHDDEYLSMSDINLETVLPEAVVPFTFKLPNAVPPYLYAHYTCETGSRLLFSSILWLGKIPVFQQLPEDIQNNLIKSCWAEIFLLNFVQMANQLSFNAVMTSIVDYFKSMVAQEQQPIDKLLTLSDNVCLFNEFVRDMGKLNLDELSFAALRVILLFNSRTVRRDFPNYTAQLERIVDVASNELRRQLARNTEALEDEMNGSGGQSHPSAEEHFVKVIMKVSTLSKFNAQVVEEFFFTNMVGQVNVENVIPYILRLGNSNISVKPEPV